MGYKAIQEIFNLRQISSFIEEISKGNCIDATGKCKYYATCIGPAKVYISLHSELNAMVWVLDKIEIKVSIIEPIIILNMSERRNLQHVYTLI